jgi:hypothetical protein
VSRFLLRCTLVVTCIAIASSAALAQEVAPPSGITPSAATPAIATPAIVASPSSAVSPSIAAHRAGPTIAEATFALRPAKPLRIAGADIDAAAVVPRREPFSRPAVLMITGGALLLTGLLVDGDASSILIIAGAGIGGYGLYLHLQSPNARLRR